MVRIHLAYTAPINPPNLPPLTLSQIWTGLQRKVRFAQEFVPVIEACTVVEVKEDGTVVRDVKFKEGAGPRPQAREVVKEFWPSWVCFAFSLTKFACFISVVLGGGGFRVG